MSLGYVEFCVFHRKNTLAPPCCTIKLPYTYVLCQINGVLQGDVSAPDGAVLDGRAPRFPLEGRAAGVRYLLPDKTRFVF